jgi:hypothetical protein
MSAKTAALHIVAELKDLPFAHRWPPMSALNVSERVLSTRSSRSDGVDERPFAVGHEPITHDGPITSPSSQMAVPARDVLRKTLQLRGKERVHGDQVTLEPGIPKYRADALEFAPCGIVSVALQAEGEHTAARRE